MNTTHDPYFTPIDEDKPLAIPDTVEASDNIEEVESFLFTEEAETTHSVIGQLIFSVLTLIVFMSFWQAYTIYMEIISYNKWLAYTFVALLTLLVLFVLKEAYQFRQGVLQFKKVESLRENAETFVKERSHGKSSAFVEALTKLYAGKAQEPFLHKALTLRHDYLNDAEVVNLLSENFFSQLDKEARRLVISESVRVGGMVAVSQVAIIDSLIVIWRTMSMVNKINSIYGLHLTQIGRWKFFMDIAKSSVLAAGSQIAITVVVDKINLPGVSIISSIGQGYGIASYVTLMGVEAMKQSRPILFDQDAEPTINLITDGIRQGLTTS